MQNNSYNISQGWCWGQSKWYKKSFMVEFNWTGQPAYYRLSKRNISKGWCWGCSDSEPEWHNKWNSNLVKFTWTGQTSKHCSLSSANYNSKTKASTSSVSFSWMSMIRRLKDWSNTFEYFSDSHLLTEWNLHNTFLNRNIFLTYSISVFMLASWCEGSWVRLSLYL